MKYYLFFPVIFILTFTACQKKQTDRNVQKNESEIVDIWVVDSLENRVDQLLLSDVAEDIEIIPLQFDKNHSFSFTDNMVAGDNDFFSIQEKWFFIMTKRENF